MVVAWLVCGVGWVGAYTIPNQFESNARLFVDADAILTPLLRGIAADSAPTTQLEILQRTLLSRPNLEKLVSKTDLDLTLNGPSDRERLINRLATEIKVDAADQEPVHHLLPRQEPEAGARRGADAADDLRRERDRRHRAPTWRTRAASWSGRSSPMSSSCARRKSGGPTSACATWRSCQPNDNPNVPALEGARDARPRRCRASCRMR